MFTQRLESQLVINRPLEEVWTFFSKPANLARLSPPSAYLKIEQPDLEQKMYPGIIVQLKMGPIPGLRLSWFSEITQIQPLEYFIDNQIAGPFSMWHHQHHFRAIGPYQTEVRDLLHYRLPLGPLGLLVNWVFVGRQVKKIFEYREEAIRKLFP